MKNLLAVYMLWLRDLKHLWYDKLRIMLSLGQSILFLFVLGVALSPNFTGISGVKFSEFIYPGIISMTLVFSSGFSAISVIWDREFGFLRAVLVSPVPRWSIVIGKVFGGVTPAILQGGFMLILAPLLGIHMSIIQLIQSIIVMLVISLSMNSLGIAVAARMKEMEDFQILMNLLILPMFYLSGALFPISNLPKWLAFVVYINPLSYGIDLLRGIMIGVNALPLYYDLLLIITFCTIMFIIAIIEFSIAE